MPRAARIFIDGSAGTTGLQIHSRLRERRDLCLLELPPERRKDDEARRQMLNEADIVFLCLPDDAARQAVGMIVEPAVRVIDASTAHRTAPGWTYGLPELGGAQRAAIAGSRRVANPGCHATGFITAVYPLVAAGLLGREAALGCFSLTGYSGGGKAMIAQYEAERPAELYAPRVYGLGQAHKHLPEMQAVCGLACPPVFCPVVDDYYKGMATTVLLPGLDADAVRRCLAAHYRGEALVTVAPEDGQPAMLAANAMAGRDDLRLYVCGQAGRCTVTAVFDNLGKGAAGAAVQNMNVMLGLPQHTGLRL